MTTETTVASVTPEERKLVDSIQSDIGWSLVETFARTRREHPEEVTRGGEILVRKLHEAGLEPIVHRPQLHLTLPVEAKIQLEGERIRAKAMAGSPNTPAFTAELVYLPARNAVSRVHTNDPAVLFGDGLTTEALKNRVGGKVVLTEGLSNPGRSELLEKMGAAAIIAINPGEQIHWGASSTVWGNPTLDDLNRLPRIPSLSVAHASGPSLIEAAQEGKSITVQVESLSGWFQQPIVEVRISGTASDGRFVLLHGHYDAWDVGVGDNATGNAVMLEVARALKAQPPRHDVRIAWWPGHSAGRYAGSTWYADQFAHDLFRQCVVHLNCDSPGCADATSYASIRGMIEAEAVVAGAVKSLFNQVSKFERPGRGGDYSFNNLGVSGALMASSMVPVEERNRRGWYSVGGNGGSPTWHTELDTIEVADRKIVENDIRLYALLVWRFASSDGTVLDYRPALAQIVERYNDSLGHVGESVDFQMHTALFGTLTDYLDAAYSKAAQDGDAAQAFRLLGRQIVRLGNAIGETYEHDPAMALPVLPLLRSAYADPSNDPAARVTLQRAANTLRERLEATVGLAEVLAR